jgi:putative two-component system response regulator
VYTMTNVASQPRLERNHPDTYTIERLHARDTELESSIVLVEWVKEEVPIQQARAYVADRNDSALLAHHDRTAVAVAVETGRRGCSLEERRLVVEAALCHDIGRLDPEIRSWVDSTERYTGVRREAFLKAVSQHSLRGAEIVLDFDWDTDDRRLAVAELVGAHHWPHYGLEPRDYPELARDLSLADGFDALCTQRDYKPAFGEAKAYEILRQEFADDATQVDVIFGYQPNLN